MEKPETSPKTVTPAANQPTEMPEEIGGKDRPEPTRYGDWELNGKCVDF